METIVLDRPNEPLGVGVQVGRTRRQADDLDAGILEQIPERRRVLQVPIEDDEPLVRQESFDRVAWCPVSRPTDGCSRLESGESAMRQRDGRNAASRRAVERIEPQRASIRHAYAARSIGC